ncbi:transposase [Moorena sp. SIO4G3]|uniref:transposase n=1 Tax=Moorena sp. SIO4G3 TaxID=2607821 RepID=UPI0025CCAFFB|nr:transposase [Moorena sp. SIO4G3]
MGYFESRTNSGVVEVINNKLKLKLIKRCGFGLTNLTNFEIRYIMNWDFDDSLAY